MSNALDIAELRQAVRYEPETGAMTWLHRPDDHFPNPGRAVAWNKRFAGKPALNCLMANGYRHGHLFNRSVLAHRVAFALMNNRWPTLIDHIDGDRSNNRASNLREVTAVANSRNAALPVNNTSGAVGVHRYKNTKRWVARIRVNYKQVFLGIFADFDQAVAARRDAEKVYNYHPNHGSKRTAYDHARPSPAESVRQA